MFVGQRGHCPFLFHSCEPESEGTYPSQESAPFRLEQEAAFRLAIRSMGRLCEHSAQNLHFIRSATIEAFRRTAVFSIFLRIRQTSDNQNRVGCLTA